MTNPFRRRYPAPTMPSAPRYPARHQPDWDWPKRKPLATAPPESPIVPRRLPQTFAELARR